MFDNLFGRFYEQFIVQKGYEVMLEGLESTVIIALGALLIGVLMGTLVAIVKVWQRHSVVGWLLNAVADLYIAIIRGTPSWYSFCWCISVCFLRWECRR